MQRFVPIQDVLKGRHFDRQIRSRDQELNLYRLAEEVIGNLLSHCARSPALAPSEPALIVFGADYS